MRQLFETEIKKSADDNVRKFVFTSKDAIAEAVLYKYPTYKDRTVICCSTQSGCPMGCTFCGTGKFYIRNLTAEEIIFQVEKCMDYFATPAADIGKLQIMFMSMGEPMLNWAETKKAIYYLNVKYSNADLLISTSGPQAPSAFGDMINTSIEIEEVGLQFSIHEADDIERNKIMPYKHKMTLIDIAAEGELWSFHTNRRPFYNYCVHDDNNQDRHANRLTSLFPPDIWECTLSVICEPGEGVKGAHARQRELVEGFMGKMLECGNSVRVFDPAGQDDIGGGCGQLWHVQNYVRKNPHLNIKGQIS
ncbi:MAG: radical SAM protein [Proteobacteria bacterium]|nr:radical SAM protein [Pseudomonadota bacterium]